MTEEESETTGNTGRRKRVLTPEQRARKTARAKVRRRERRESMTDEQKAAELAKSRAAYAARRRSYTPEKLASIREHRREYQRGWRKRMTPEQKAKWNAYSREYRRRLPEEAKEANRKRTRDWWANATPERRAQVYARKRENKTTAKVEAARAYRAASRIPGLSKCSMPTTLPGRAVKYVRLTVVDLGYDRGVLEAMPLGYRRMYSILEGEFGRLTCDAEAVAVLKKVGKLFMAERFGIVIE